MLSKHCKYNLVTTQEIQNKIFPPKLLLMKNRIKNFSYLMIQSNKKTDNLLAHKNKNPIAIKNNQLKKRNLKVKKYIQTFKNAEKNKKKDDN